MASDSEASWVSKSSNRLMLIRAGVLLFFPLISLFYQDWISTICSGIIGCIGIFFDRIRHQRRIVSFPIFACFVWGTQVMIFALVYNYSYLWAFGGSLPKLFLEDPKIAMAKWDKFDENIAKQVNSIPWSVELNATDFPWLREFPPLTNGSAPPHIKTASIILAAHNEHKYLQRTIESIWQMSPSDQLVEIIVVDDASEPPLSEITEKMSHTQTDHVRIIRHDSRQGLIRSKSDGANAAIGDLIIFLDAHVKPESNDWLAPLFKHTNENYKRIVTPIIPILNGDTWTVDSKAIGIKMMFDWAMGFNWFDDGNDWVPIMSGGLLAITRRWFHEGGAYDDQMLYWGGENIEQSVRTWLCGGEIVVARDSRVSHVFRPTFPYTINHTQVNINKVRTVEVWFDEYKEFYYRSDPYARTLTNYKGDLTERNALKARLGCKPFQYFVDRFRAVFDMKNMLPKRHVAIKDEKTNLCLEAHKEGYLVFGDCKNAIGDKYRTSMRFVADFPPDNPKVEPRGIIRSLKFADKCFDANGQVPEKADIRVLLYTCMAKNKQQESWSISDGGLRWGNDWCAYRSSKDKTLSFGECKREESSEGFLGKLFHGHSEHQFVIYDEQSMEIAKSDADKPEDEDE